MSSSGQQGPRRGPGLRRALVEHGLTARLMLLSSRAETYERGRRREAVSWRARVELLDAGASVSVVVPVCQGNVDELVELVEDVAGRLGEVEALTLRPVFFSVPQRGPTPTIFGRAPPGIWCGWRSRRRSSPPFDARRARP